ncbi:nucleotidyltransferase family protein [Methanobacterium alcaliphilum]|uniref:nucleotidyltransferase domain-containing protein n=1 Tax=Methanobacterium alcaliphilum TaxID=392018 RepID=UPI003184336F
MKWDYLIAKALLHRVMPLLYINLNSICPESVPNNILSQLKNFFNENAKKNLLLTGELITVMNLLRSKDIDTFSYKGPILASTAYGNITFREFSDIDILLTNRSDALKAKNIILSRGYELYHPKETKSENKDPYMKLLSEFTFINPKTRSTVEIKWNFEGMFFSFPKNPNFLLNDPKIFEISEFKLKTFSQVNQILILSIHVAKHGWTRLSWICDISEFIQRENIDWYETLEKAEKLGVKRILMINLSLARDFFGLELPDTISYDLSSDDAVKTISDIIKKRIFYENNKSLNIFEKSYIYFKKRENVMDGIKDCLNILTRPVYRDYKDIPLPQFLFPLYFILHPILLIIRYH